MYLPDTREMTSGMVIIRERRKIQAAPPRRATRGYGLPVA